MCVCTIQYLIVIEERKKKQKKKWPPADGEITCETCIMLADWFEENDFAVVVAITVTQILDAEHRTYEYNKK